MTSQLFIVGTPLNETSLLSHDAIACIRQSSIIICESRKRTLSLFAKSSLRLSEELFCFLDSCQDFSEIKSRIIDAVQSASSQNAARVTLLSDSGMPILFDPGKEVLDLCRSLGFRIRTTPEATSWSTACAVSGFSPPFLIHDFLPQKSPERIATLHTLKNRPENIVLLETPYRFHVILSEMIHVFGKDRQAFLAWQIAYDDEWYGWGRLETLLANAEKTLPKKGEFVVIVKPA